MNRYRSDNRVRGGNALGTNQSVTRIKLAVRQNRIRVRTHILKENERMDSVAHRFLGNAKFWWVIAACSNIGWNMQVPAGTKLSIPLSLDDINGLL